MVQDLLDSHTRLDVAVQHQADQVNTIIAHDVRDTEVAVHDLIDAVERILLVDDGIKEDT